MSIRAGQSDGMYRLDDIKCLSFKKKLYRFYRKTSFMAVLYVTDTLFVKLLILKQPWNTHWDLRF